MEVQYYGANCVVLTGKQARVVVDDTLADVGGRSVAREGDILLHTATHAYPPPKPAKIAIDQPGEYEVAGVSIYGISARAHVDTEDQRTATMYKLVFEDISVLLTGHVYPELADAQLEAIGMVDILFVPVGGNGYTMDGIGALKIIKKIEPKIVIPTHYADPDLALPMPQQTLEEALKALAMEPKETLTKLKLKATDLPTTTGLIVLSRS